MRTPKKPKGKLIMLFAAVVVFQCCCCIVPYTLNVRLDNFSLTTFMQPEQNILFPPRESLKASNPGNDLFVELKPEAGKAAAMESAVGSVSAFLDLPAQPLEKSGESSLISYWRIE